MNVLLTHPIHGGKYATFQWELENDLKNGWVILEERPLEPIPIVQPHQDSYDAIGPDGNYIDGHTSTVKKRTVK